MPVNQSAGDWLLARCHPEGGFLAAPGAPIPDLLSTATALHALAGLQVSFARVKEKYEIHHGVTITDNAIIAAATLSDRYIGDRFLPDKAIDLIDEASSRVRMAVDSKPEELDEPPRWLKELADRDGVSNRLRILEEGAPQIF